VVCKTGLVGVTEPIALIIAANADLNQAELRLKATVKSLRPIEDRDASDKSHYGLEFADIGAEQSRALLDVMQKHLLNEM